MKFLRKRIAKRFPLFGRAADFALVGGAALRFAQRKGMISDDAANRFGAASSSGGSALSMGEAVMAGGAALRMARRFVSKRRAKSLAKK